ncbi:hypothetical protein IWW35_003090 [Coemansia sp. RSA 1878]|nr:hypothetical protein IWW35_003090 [Coemansia sp. RSA 1878]
MTDEYKSYKATTVNCRSSPNTSGKVVKTYATNDKTLVTFQTSGMNIKGSALKGNSTNDCYIADYYPKPYLLDTLLKRAAVAKVSGNIVTIEKYNHGGTERDMPKSAFNYIHKV